VHDLFHLFPSARMHGRQSHYKRKYLSVPNPLITTVPKSHRERQRERQRERERERERESRT
jgi:hypothetical protein